MIHQFPPVNQRKKVATFSFVTFVLAMTLSFCFTPLHAHAQTKPASAPSAKKEAPNSDTNNSLKTFQNKVLVVGTKSSPPFSMMNKDGSWTGISIELWKDLARKLKLKYRFKEMPLKDLLSGLQNKKLDAVVASLTITPDREKVFDFTHPFHSTGLTMAVSPDQGASLWSSVKTLFSWKFFEFLLALFGVLFLTGLIVWFLERKRNKEQFGGNAAQGIGSGIWWSAVSMTTVGYGDKAPITFWGRVVGMIWIFASLILVSSFTAALTSILTVGKLEGDIEGAQDLYRLRVATVNKSTSHEFLKNRATKMRVNTATLDESMQQLLRKKVDAVVYDAPILRYMSNTNLRGAIKVLPNTFLQQDYGIGLPTGSPLREQLNREILAIIYSQQWRLLLRRFLGPMTP